MILDGGRYGAPLDKGRILQHAQQEIAIGFQTMNICLTESMDEFSEGGVSIFSPGNQFCQQGVVMNADLLVEGNPGFDAESLDGFRPLAGDDPSRGGKEVVCRILGVEARLDGVALPLQILLRHGEGSSLGHGNLPFDQIQSGDHLRHRMLDL